MGNLFDIIESTGHFTVPNDDWRPSAPPCLNGIQEIKLDCETTGLRWWEDDRPIGIGICLPDGSTQYLPWGHRGGGNLDEAVVKRWAQTELRGKHIVNLNTRFDVHMLREWGVDLEAQGCTVSDVGHYAALLDDHRLRSSLESLCSDFLPETERKVKIINGVEIDPTRMGSYSAGTIAVRAEADVRQVHLLKQVLWPKLDVEDLQRVRQLEDDVIYVVCEMEKNGAIIDHELLEKWIKETATELQRCLLAIVKIVGFQVNPESSKDQEKLFRHLKIPFTEFTETGRPSFTDNVIKQLDHPVIKLMRRAKKIFNIRSKYLLKYQKAVDSHGILRYALHQLRAIRNEGDDERDTGTISGRFSSTELVPGVGVNIQQVMKAEKQIITHGDEFLIRQLHISETGLFFSADAKQIEYRLFANEICSPRILKAYEENPDLSFHKMIHKMLLPYKSNLTYKRAKDLSFATIYGAGLTKIALMLEFINSKEFLELREQKATGLHPKLAQVAEIRKIYNREIPEAAALLRRYSAIAEQQEYITTILGRRMRFINGIRSYKALNGRIQGSAADIMKAKLIELHKTRLQTGLKLRFTVHDECDGDIPNQEAANIVATILDNQDFSFLKVPIRWDVKTGINWLDCSRIDIEETRKQL